MVGIKDLKKFLKRKKSQFNWLVNVNINNELIF